MFSNVLDLREFVLSSLDGECLGEYTVKYSSFFNEHLMTITTNISKFDIEYDTEYEGKHLFIRSIRASYGKTHVRFSKGLHKIQHLSLESSNLEQIGKRRDKLKRKIMMWSTQTQTAALAALFVPTP